MVTVTAAYSSWSVTSADGTRIGNRQVGRGPGLVLVHGGGQAAQNLARTFRKYPMSGRAFVIVASLPLILAAWVWRVGLVGALQPMLEVAPLAS